MKRVYAICLIALSAIFTPALSFAVDGATQAGAEAAVTKININTASVDALATLKGIGLKKAQAIIDYRDQIGAFKAIEQLLEVKGIGEKLLGRIRGQITL